MKRYKEYYVPIFFLIISIIAIFIADVSANFIVGELYSRFVRNAIFLLALIIPIIGGMGINFSITIGAIAAQISMVIVIDMGLSSRIGFLFATLLSIVLSIIFGNIIGSILNKAKGKEMIASMVIGFLGTSIYQLIFMVGYGTVIKPFNQDTLLIRGIGVKSMLDAGRFRDLYKDILPIRMGDVDGSLVPIIIIVFVALIVWLITKSKVGYI